MANGLLPVERQPSGLLPATVQDRAYGLLGADPTVDRATFLPMGRTAEGELTFAWPGALIDMAKNALLPGHVVQGGAWTPQDAAEFAIDYGLLGTGATAARATGRGGIRGLLDPATASTAGAKPGGGLLDDAARGVDNAGMSTPKRFFHATGADFEEFSRPDLVGGKRPIWLTDDPAYANWILEKKGITAGANVRPVGVTGKLKSIDLIDEAKRVAEQAGIPGPEDAMGAQEILAGTMGWDDVANQILEDALSEGFDGVRLSNFHDNFYGGPTEAVLIADPSKIKSPF